jgi:protein-disulfide isomerase
MIACASRSTPRPAPDGSESAAEVRGHMITVAEVDAQIKERLFEERVRGDATMLYKLRAETLDRMIDERLRGAGASQRGVTSDQLARAGAQDGANIGDEEVEAFYREHQATMGGFSLEQLAPQIRRYLAREGKKTAPGGLREREGVVVYLEMPRVIVAADGPARGPADARVTIIEFADFQCPYCQRSVATLEKVLARYPQDVRLVYRHLPIEKLHLRARAAAEAAACAEEQGAFWPYHDKLFANNFALERDDLVRYAGELGLDTGKFTACVDEQRYRAKIDRDLAAAHSLGMDGTPTFVVNGILVAGAKPPEEFYHLIDSELARTASK